MAQSSVTVMGHRMEYNWATGQDENVNVDFVVSQRTVNVKIMVLFWWYFIVLLHSPRQVALLEHRERYLRLSALNVL